MSAIEVLKKMINEKKPYECYMDDKIKLNALKEALLALEKQKNGLKCIGCGSIPKLKLCCNSCYQRLKLKEKRQVELIEWLEKEIELRKIKHDCIAKQAYKSSEDLFRIGELETEVTSLKEVLERVGEQK
jgi:hypothetical protein